jgi:hypothetical protein
MLVRLQDGNALWPQHIDGAIGSVDDHHKLKKERPPQDTVAPDVETDHLKCQYLPALVFS